MHLRLGNTTTTFECREAEDRAIEHIKTLK